MGELQLLLRLRDQLQKSSNQLQQTKKLNWWKDKMAVFNWTYFSFTDIDTTWLYREMVLIPILIFFLWVFWMKVVRSAMKDAINSPEPMSIDEAYANAVITEALDTEDEMTDAEKSTPGSPIVTKSDLNAATEVAEEPTEEDKKNL